MSKYDLDNTAVTNYSSLDAHTVDLGKVDTVQDQDETYYTNERFSTDWGYFLNIPKLKSAILMKSIWTVGKGYTCDTRTKVILNGVTGDGKQTFKDILFSMDVTKRAARDSYAEIIKDEDGNLINLKLLDPSNVRTVYGRDGRIKRYELLKRIPAGIIGKAKSLFGMKTYQKYKPDEIFHLSHNKFAGSMHGISVPESVEKIILADDENFNIMRKLTRFQAVPFIIFKVKADDPSTIARFKQNIKDARTSGEDLIVPDDENILSWEVIQVTPSSVLMEWRNNLNNQFYQAVGMPLILFGSAGSTESGGKIEYLGHETVFEHEQREIEEQIYSQLGLEINLNPPTSLLENLQQDENKDAQNALSFQPSDITAGSGR